MKKMLMLFTLICSLSAFAYVSIPNFSWNNTNLKTIEEYISYLQKNAKQDKDYNLQIFDCIIMKELLGKNDKSITYHEFKQIILEQSKQFKGKIDQTKINFSIARYTFLIRRFNGFCLSALNDKQIEKDIPYFFKYYYIFNVVYSKMEIKQFRDFCFEIVKSSANGNKMAEKNLLKTVGYYQNRLIEIQPSQAKADLKKMKILIYPKINESEYFKQVAVKIELMIKSLE